MSRTSLLVFSLVFSLGLLSVTFTAWPVAADDLEIAAARTVPREVAFVEVADVTLTNAPAPRPEDGLSLTFVVLVLGASALTAVTALKWRSTIL
jgi:hypothetical protein